MVAPFLHLIGRALNARLDGWVSMSEGVPISTPGDGEEAGA